MDERDDLKVYIGNKIQEERTKKHWSQREFREAAKALAGGKVRGLSQSNLSMIENGEIEPPLTTLQVIADTLGVDIREFFPKKKESNDIDVNYAKRISDLEKAHTSKSRRAMFILKELSRFENLIQYLREDFPEYVIDDEHAAELTEETCKS